MVNFSIKKSERAVSVAQMIVHLPTKHNTLSSNPKYHLKRKRKKERERGKKGGRKKGGMKGGRKGRKGRRKERRKGGRERGREKVPILKVCHSESLFSFPVWGAGNALPPFPNFILLY
jgi:hypothetical protein